jgi:hypothetical protein
VNLPVTFAVVLAATYGLANAILSFGLAVAWRAGLARRSAPANLWLTLRMLPAGGAALFALGAVLPAFIIHEPAQLAAARSLERGGPILTGLTLIAALTVGAGLTRAWRARRAASALVRACRPAQGVAAPMTAGQPAAGRSIDLFEGPMPMVAVVGSWRPRILAGAQVRQACTPAEFGLVIAHERAHISAADNLKLLLHVLAPDVLAWLPAGAAITARWRAAAEREADERAAGSDPHRRLALASALVKVARLATTPTATARARPALLMPMTDHDGVAVRVRALLAQPAPAGGRWSPAIAAWAPMVALPLMAMPLYGPLHEMVELLVALGR